MKKWMCIVSALALVLSMTAVMAIPVGAASYSQDAVAEHSGYVHVEPSGISNWAQNDYVIFKNVDMTGVRSVRLLAKTNLGSGYNGEIYAIRLDGAKGKIIGWVRITDEVEKEYAANLDEAVSGIHDICIQATYGHSKDTYIKTVTFSQDAINDVYTPVPDSAIIDNYHDTWVCVDDLGRAVADYEEVGDVVNEDKYIGMFYWNWHSPGNVTVTNPWRIVAEHPESKYEYNSKVWSTSSAYYWDEPVYGYYDNRDYWVYRRQAVLMANADVDVTFFDYTNGDSSWYGGLKVQLDAWRDARESGVDAPKISALCSWKTNKANSVKFLYLTMFRDGNYSDLWFYWDGKPLLMSGVASGAERYPDPSDTEYKVFLDEMYDFFTFRTSGGRSGQSGPNQFIWLENYPQHRFGEYKDGRVEFMSLGCAINESYVWGPSITGVFSDEYTKGRSYTEAFGEDWRENSCRQNYFFREQASRVLDIDPAFVFVDGWNEWRAGRQALYSGVENCFVDTYDDEGSRDIEPTKGVMGDDTYNMFVDFVRKYRGVRPAPLATAEKTVDIEGDAAQWSDVGPEFINDFDDYERDSTSYIDSATGEKYHFTTKVNNSIARAKVARDAENYYFGITATRDIVTGTAGWMNLYINIDRNHATGWQGYDFAVNRGGAGVIEKNTGAWSWEAIGKAEYTVKGKLLQIKVPRALLGKTDVTDFEFKVTDAIEPNGDILTFYTEGSAAPMGRFNYLYTEIAQTSTTAAQRDALYMTTIFKKGSNRMMVEGGKMYVYEKDTRIATFEEDGALYVPVEAYEDVLGYGKSKFVYDNYDNVLTLEAHDLDEVTDEISDYRWTYTVLGSYEARVNGRAVTLSHPVKAVDGVIYVPTTYLTECFGYDSYDTGDGYLAYAMYGVDIGTVNTVKSLL